VLARDGSITLEGEVAWNYQREQAEQLVRDVPGVRAVTNAIEIRPQLEAADIQRKIGEAFKRNAAIDASRVSAQANGSEVILRGKVRSWAERAEAERAAWSAPGVTNVDNRINVVP
jgi:osmotically-inducible protein OsmY